MNLQLEGEVDTRYIEVEELRREKDRLQLALGLAELEAKQARQEASRAVASLRRVLDPMYRALKVVYGEMDAIAVDDGISEEGRPAASAVWESWKAKLGGQKAQCIDAFLNHGALTQTQLRVIVGCATSSVPGLISDLNRLGLIEKNGSKYQLKQL